MTVTWLCSTTRLRPRKLAAWLESFFDAGLCGEAGAGSPHFLQVVTMYGLDTLSFKELDPPAARGPLSDNNALKIAVSGVSRSPQRAHSDAITEHERLLRFQRSVCFGTRAARFP